MKCPNSDGDLKDSMLGVIPYHRCQHCEGLWFDKGELSGIRNEKDWFKIDSEFVEAKTTVQKAKTKCPRCSLLLNSVEYSHETSIKVAICPNCEGLWMEKGELSHIHKASESWLERVREKAEDRLIAIELFFIKITPNIPR